MQTEDVVIVPAPDRLNCPIHDNLRRSGFVHEWEARHKAVHVSMFDRFDRDSRTEIIEIMRGELNVAATARLHLGSVDRSDDVIQSWTRCRSPSPFGPDVAAITRLAVDEEAQGQGLANYLMRVAVNLLRERKFSRANVVVKVDHQQMLRLLGKIGFELLPSNDLVSYDIRYFDGKHEIAQAVPVVAMSLDLCG